MNDITTDTAEYPDMSILSHFSTTTITKYCFPNMDQTKILRDIVWIKVDTDGSYIEIHGIVETNESSTNFLDF